MKLLRDNFKYLLSPLLLTVFPLLFVYQQNLRKVPLNSIFRPLVIIFCLIIINYLILLRFIKNKIKTSLLVSFYSILLFSYGHIIRLTPYFELYRSSRIVIGKNKVIFPLVLILAILFTLFILKTKRKFSNGLRLTTYLSLFLILINLVPIIAYQYNTSILAPPPALTPRLNSDYPYQQKPASKPDIYYIITDAHTNTDILKSIYNYEDKTLVPYLTKKGFFVAQNSRTNYLHTLASLASSLNMDFSESLTQTDVADGDKLIKLIDQNAAGKFLKNNGYFYLTFNSGIFVTEKSSLADILYNYQYGLTNFEQLFINTTVFYKILQLVKVDLAFLHRQRVLSIFETLKEISHNPETTFTFAHIISPHPPFIFDENGNALPVKRRLTFADSLTFPGTKEEYKKGYLSQLKFIDKKLVETVSYILANSSDKPIIIIQGDHGSSSEVEWARKEEFAKLTTVENKLYDPNNQLSLLERSSTLNAYYIPSAECKSQLYDTISPVNSFRLIFNCYFTTQFELLPDKTNTHY